MRISILLLTLLILLSCEREENLIIPDPPYLYHDNNPSWSNSGDKIAFHSTGDKQQSDSTQGLYVINTDGSEKVFLDELYASTYIDPVWLHGDTEIVYSYLGVYKININSKEKSELMEVVSDFDISLDGRQIYYRLSSDSLNCNNLILHKDLQTGKTDTITCGKHPSISSDLQFMAFSKDGYINYYSFIDSSAMSLNLEGSFPDWSPTGDLLVYEFGDGLYRRSNIYVTELSARRYKVVESGRLANISPNGDKIVYVDYSDHLWIINLDGSDNTQLTF